MESFLPLLDLLSKHFFFNVCHAQPRPASQLIFKIGNRIFITGNGILSPTPTSRHLKKKLLVPKGLHFYKELNIYFQTRNGIIQTENSGRTSQPR